VSNNNKRTAEKTSLSLKETPPASAVKGEPCYATREEMEKALQRVMKVHGAALKKLAE
jgi:hypothetical protein